MSALFVQSTCVHVRSFCLAHLRMCSALWTGTYRYLIFYYFESLNLWFAIWVSFHQGQNLCHRSKPVSKCQQSPSFDLMATQSHSKCFLPLWHQGQRVMLPLSTCWNLCSAMLSKLPLTFRQDLHEDVLQKKYDFIHHNWPSYHQRLIHMTPKHITLSIPSIVGQPT